MNISIREFTINPYKYLKDLKEELVITKQNKPVFILNVATNIKKSVDVATKDLSKVVEPTISSFGTYGCGCTKTDKMLCSKHGRS